MLGSFDSTSLTRQQYLKGKKENDYDLIMVENSQITVFKFLVLGVRIGIGAFRIYYRNSTKTANPVNPQLNRGICNGVSAQQLQLHVTTHEADINNFKFGKTPLQGNTGKW